MAKADWPPKSKMFTSQLMAEKSAEACMELDTKPTFVTHQTTQL